MAKFGKPGLHKNLGSLPGLGDLGLARKKIKRDGAVVAVALIVYASRWFLWKFFFGALLKSEPVKMGDAT